jgi:Leucine-rich repeat (LRR) protein
MRTTETLFDMEEITILYQYLYMDENHFITIDNSITKLEIRMRENCSFKAKNLRFPDVPDLEYTDMMTIPNILGIIDQLKHVPAVEFPTCFTNRWEEIKTITTTNVAQNKMNQRRG